MMKTTIPISTMITIWDGCPGAGGSQIGTQKTDFECSVMEYDIHQVGTYWIVVEGTANVTIDDCVQTMTEGQSVYVPLGARHRLKNPAEFPMVLIEVQIGTYLGEDDIVRYEDLYARK